MIFCCAEKASDNNTLSWAAAEGRPINTGKQANPPGRCRQHISLCWRGFDLTQDQKRKQDAWREGTESEASKLHQKEAAANLQVADNSAGRETD